MTGSPAWVYLSCRGPRQMREYCPRCATGVSTPGHRGSGCGVFLEGLRGWAAACSARTVPSHLPPAYSAAEAPLLDAPQARPGCGGARSAGRAPRAWAVVSGGTLPLDRNLARKPAATHPAGPPFRRRAPVAPAARGARRFWPWRHSVWL